ncbi:MAG: prepilin-type N-terminal cleavage/methylation domain-containing protein [Methylomarinum sp.]|nr:prepilin-type N-terminal cleavage/methylation domain-containing protein [Methylomarinum sp.]
MLKKNKIAGFTLLEVMLAMTLLSIMVTLLFASLKVAAESWNKGEAKIAEVNEKAVVYQFFKRHLPSIQPLWDEFSDDDRQFSFQGENDKFQFVSVFPASAGRKGLQLFEIIFDKAAEGQVKVRLKPFYPASEDQQWQQEEVVLLEHVSKFKISYFAKDISGSEGEWHDSWKEKQHLPALIKINIELVKQGFWPEMVFALKLAATNADSNLERQ